MTEIIWTPVTTVHNAHQHDIVSTLMADVKYPFIIMTN